MSTGVYAAVMTGKGVGAISTIHVSGTKSHEVIKKIFSCSKNHTFSPDKILLGDIVDGDNVIDQVTIGCETLENFHINCHGNPLIVSDIMQLLYRNKVKLLTAEQLLSKIFEKQGLNALAIEAKISLPKAKTLAGSYIISNQIKGGFGKRVSGWLKDFKSISLEKIKKQARQILELSETAKLIIFGCQTILTGPPNSGKSTLLNCITGKEKAIVTEIAGTTRDWVSGSLHIEPLYFELIDTAGVEEVLSNVSDNINKESQKKSLEILEKSDLVFLVLDANKEVPKFNEHILSRLGNKRILTVLNKTDLSFKIDIKMLGDFLKNNYVKISAKNGDGIKKLKQKMLEICDVKTFKLTNPVCITDRQKKLLNKLIQAKTKQSAAEIIERLLKGKVFV